jgi:hypothetical protein
LTRCLPDTTIVSDLARRPRGMIAAGIARVGEDNVCTSVVVPRSAASASPKGVRPLVQRTPTRSCVA